MEREVLIKNSFLLPILLVVFMSISHVISWYDIGNPFAWAIYLSIAVEIFALASVSAASININRASVWFLFAIVTSIQIIGNIYFEFNDIDENSKLFKSWMLLVQPFFNEEWLPVDHRRLLAIIQGGSIPMMSLIALHYYIKFGDKLRERNTQETVDIPKDNKPAEQEKQEKSLEDLIKEEVVEPKKEEPKQSQKKPDDDSLNPAYGVHHE